jgi:hypothetical protein
MDSLRTCAVFLVRAAQRALGCGSIVAGARSGTIDADAVRACGDCLAARAVELSLSFHSFFLSFDANLVAQQVSHSATQSISTPLGKRALGFVHHGLIHLFRQAP